ncbi:hypothetical protein [Pedobacter lusitanus]|uniref:hypothetical protein n=1 Tax=Pedobacter lusitanus TaxID=1503925 RepID=UPI0012698864|nr:hypothetical protein [Pedobacter lusitanus]
MRKVREAEKDENNKAVKNVLNQLSISFYQHHAVPSLNTTVFIIEDLSGYSRYSYNYTSNYCDQIFRPPKIAA